MKKRSTSLIAGILCLAAAAAWHSLDVRTGIHETGASWQMGRYLLLIVLVLVLTTVCGYFLLEKAVPCSLLKLAVLMTGGLGILYLFVLPPLTAPDEISHYVSAYRLSSQMTGQPQRDRYGRVLLRAQDAWIEDLNGDFVYEPDEDGNLQQADNTLVESEVSTYSLYGDAKSYVNSAGSYQAMLTVGAEEGTELLTIASDDHLLTLTPARGDFTDGIVKDNAIRYNNVLPDVDYQYTIFGNSVKEDIFFFF